MPSLRASSGRSPQREGMLLALPAVPEVEAGVGDAEWSADRDPLEERAAEVGERGPGRRGVGDLAEAVEAPRRRGGPGQLGELRSRKDPGDLPPEGHVEGEVAAAGVGEEEASPLEESTEAGRLGFVEDQLPVAGQVDEGVLPQVGIGEGHELPLEPGGYGGLLS